MPNKPTVVRTNSTPGSVKIVELKVVTFAEFWMTYPQSEPCINPSTGMPAFEVRLLVVAETVTGRDWQTRVKGRTGIIFFGSYWRRSLKECAPSGDHIDLWNRERLTPSAETTLRFDVGIPKLWNPLSVNRTNGDECGVRAFAFALRCALAAAFMLALTGGIIAKARRSSC